MKHDILIEPSFPKRVNADIIRLKITIEAWDLRVPIDVAVEIHSEKVDVGSFAYMSLGSGISNEVKKVALAFAKECNDRKIV